MNNPFIFDVRDDTKPFCNMTLRDYFAAAALTGWLANPKNYLNFKPDDDAQYLYKLADAMLAEREKTK